MTREAVKLSEEAVKLLALGAKNLAALCLAMAKDNRKLKGKTKLKRLLTEGKELRVFDLKEEDVSAFANLWDFVFYDKKYKIGSGYG